MGAKINKSRFAVLGLLSMEPMSGYDIKKKFETIASNFWNESYGQIYPILKRLNEEGLTTRSVEKQQGRPDRHIYRITPSGLEILKKWLLEPVGRHVGRHEILLKLYFGTNVTQKDNIRQIRHFQAIYQDELKDLKQVKLELKADKGKMDQLPYLMQVIRFGELVNEALLTWSRETIELMENMND